MKAQYKTSILYAYEIPNPLQVHETSSPPSVSLQKPKAEWKAEISDNKTRCSEKAPESRHCHWETVSWTHHSIPTRPPREKRELTTYLFTLFLLERKGTLFSCHIQIPTTIKQLFKDSIFIVSKSFCKITFDLFWLFEI